MADPAEAVSTTPEGSRGRAATGARHCTRCGEPLATHRCCKHVGRPGTSLDPPRFCARCGARVTIQVLPSGYTTRCLRCERRARAARI